MAKVPTTNDSPNFSPKKENLEFFAAQRHAHSPRWPRHLLLVVLLDDHAIDLFHHDQVLSLRQAVGARVARAARRVPPRLQDVDDGDVIPSLRAHPYVAGRIQFRGALLEIRRIGPVNRGGGIDTSNASRREQRPRRATAAKRKAAKSLAPPRRGARRGGRHIDFFTDHGRAPAASRNAAESLVVHADVAETFLPMVAAVFDGVELVGDERARAIVDMGVARDDDFATEFLAMKMSVRVVDDLDEAISHVNETSTGHSEAIITNDIVSADRFAREVDAAAVLVNASTRFVDGEEFGFGAEIGISTQKLHARGPMGLKQLTTEKFVVRGTGQIRG